MSVTYKSVKENMLTRIMDREWAPGETVPHEEDLARSYGCARATVNRALRELADAGLVERRRKAGTRVVQRETRGATFQIPLVRVEIEKTGRAYGYRLLRRSTVLSDSDLVGRFDTSEGNPILHLQCLHLADGEPYQLENRWIDLKTVPDAADEDFEIIGPNEWLLSAIPFTHAEHVFSAAMPNGDEREHLQLDSTDAVFIIERRTWLSGNPVTYVRLSHIGSSFRLHSQDTDLG